jgi:hypothetical protein
MKEILIKAEVFGLQGCTAKIKYHKNMILYAG